MLARLLSELFFTSTTVRSTATARAHQERQRSFLQEWMGGGLSSRRASTAALLQWSSQCEGVCGLQQVSWSAAAFFAILQTGVNGHACCRHQPVGWQPNLAHDDSVVLDYAETCCLSSKRVETNLYMLCALYCRMLRWRRCSSRRTGTCRKHSLFA